jgi:hypothetical protein
LGNQDRFGGASGGETGLLTLDDDEHITGIVGTYGAYVNQIKFVTNKQSTAMFGSSIGEHKYIYSGAPNYELVGFFGYYGGFVDAIGFIFRDDLH